MINKKGFTLIELMAVIVILGIITVIVYPTIDESIFKSKDTAYQTQVSDIINGAKNWAADNATLLPDKGKSVSVTLGTLQDGGYVNDDLQNPKNKKTIARSSSVKITNQSNQFKYDFTLVQ